MYTEYQIRQSFIEVLKQALEEMGVKGYVVLARNQQTMTHAYDCVIVDKVNMHQNGVQSRRILKYVDESGVKHFLRRQDWIETWTWQISVSHRRRVDETVESITGEDVANRLRVWLNSIDGAAVMRNKKLVPFAPFQVFDLRLRPYKDDSDINQIEAMFDFKMNVVQFRDTPPVKVEGWDWDMHGV